MPYMLRSAYDTDASSRWGKPFAQTIYRDVEFPDDATLSMLHVAIIGAMRWTNTVMRARMGLNSIRLITSWGGSQPRNSTMSSHVGIQLWYTSHDVGAAARVIRDGIDERDVPVAHARVDDLDGAVHACDVRGRLVKGAHSVLECIDYFAGGVAQDIGVLGL